MAGTKQKEIKKQLLKQKLKKKSVDTDSDDSDEYETLSSSSEEEDEDEESDSTYKPPKSKKNKKNSKNMKKGKYADSSDSDDESEDEEVDRAELQKIISKIFPSKYTSKRAKNTEKSKKRLKDLDNKKKYNTRNHKKKRRYEESSEEEDDDYYEEDDGEDDSDDEEYGEDDSDDEEDDEQEQGVYNIVMLGGGEEDDEEYIEDNADCDSDDEKMFMKENFEKDSSTIDGDDINKKHKKKNKKKSEEEQEEAETELNDVEQEYIDLVETRKTLTAQFKKKPKNKVLKKSIDDCNKSILKLIKKARNKNAKIYHKLIHNDKKKANEVDFFKKKLSNKEQLRVMQDLKEINKHINIQKPYRLALLDTNIPPNFKAAAMQRLNVLRTMEPGDPEYYKIKNYSILSNI